MKASKGKVKSTGKGSFAKAGGKAMFGAQGATPAKAGSSTASSGSVSNKFVAKAGGKAMAGFTPAAPGKAK